MPVPVPGCVLHGGSTKFAAYRMSLTWKSLCPHPDALRGGTWACKCQATQTGLTFLSSSNGIKFHGFKLPIDHTDATPGWTYLQMHLKHNREVARQSPWPHHRCREGPTCSVGRGRPDGVGPTPPLTPLTPPSRTG